jgi:hypothetical protein
MLLKSLYQLNKKNCVTVKNVSRHLLRSALSKYRVRLPVILIVFFLLFLLFDDFFITSGFPFIISAFVAIANKLKNVMSDITSNETKTYKEIQRKLNESPTLNSLGF